MSQFNAINAAVVNPTLQKMLLLKRFGLMNQYPIYTTGCVIFHGSDGEIEEELGSLVILSEKFSFACESIVTF